MATPPRLAERLLRWSLADDERDAVLGDLQEEFAAIARDDPARAARWYWSQVALSLGPNLARRVRKHVARKRQLEPEEDRLGRLKSRKWGLVLLISGIAGFFLPVQTFIVVLGGLAALFGSAMFFGSFFARRPRDPWSAAIARRRNILFWLFYFLSVWPEIILGRTHLVLDLEGIPLLVGILLLLWPRKYWIFGSSFVPRAPQIRAPFIAPGPSSQESIWLTIDAPESPVSVSDLIVVRDGGRRIIGISRVFSNADSLRVYAAIGEGPESTHVTVDVLDSSEHVVRSVPATLTRAELVNLGVPARKPKVPLGQIETVIDVHDLPAGDYQIRVTAAEGARRSERYADFRIANPELSALGMRH